MNKIPHEKVDFFEKKIILTKLEHITEKDWNEIIDRCKNAIKYRVRYCKRGAHSEKELGCPALDYYITESISKIYQFKWIWDHERVTIEEQIITIAQSLISRQVDSYKRKLGNENTITYNDELAYDLFDEVYDSNIDLLLECIERITSKEHDLSIHWDAIKEGFKPREIATLMEIPVNKVYKQNERLIRQAKTNCLSN